MDFFSLRIAPQKLLIALGVIVSLFVSAFDSFRLSSASGHASGDAATALLSPLYPMTTGSIAQDSIATLFATQDSLDDLELDTPFLSYEVQTELVDTLSRSRPTAIFLDFSYKRWRNVEAGLEGFAAAVADAKARGVPVLTGPIAPDPAFDTLRAAAIETDIDWLNSDRMDYPFDGLRLAPFAERAGTATPAMRLYDIVCAGESARRYYKCDLAGKPAGPDIAVEWARGAHPDLGAWWGQVVDACPKTNTGPGGGVSLFVTALARNLFHRLALEQGTGVDVCTYHLSSPVHFALSAQGAKAFARSTDVPALPEDLRGRVVMIGSDLGEDEFRAPGQGMAPGVLHHAMALDNLLSRGAAYRRSPGAIHIGFERDPAKRPLRIGVSSIIEIALSLIIGFLVSNVIHGRVGDEHPFHANVTGALAAVGALTALVGVFVASSASAGVTLGVAIGLLALAVFSALGIPRRAD